jgi:hypothetical protein
MYSVHFHIQMLDKPTTNTYKPNPISLPLKMPLPVPPLNSGTESVLPPSSNQQ